MIEILRVKCKSDHRLQIDGEYYDVGPISDNFILSVSFKRITLYTQITIKEKEYGRKTKKTGNCDLPW
jgi:hypothetical protein